MANDTTTNSENNHLYDSLAGSFRFKLQVPGLDNSQQLFSEVTGLQATVTTEPVKEGGVNDHVIQLPVSITYPNLVLKRGIVDPKLFDWVMEYKKNGKITKQNLTLALLGRDGITVIQEWYFYEAYPIKWNGPSMNAGTKAIAMEAIEFVHTGISNPASPNSQRDKQVS